MTFTYDDGGRAAAGYKGDAGDCVTRSIAIATGMPYQLVYDIVNGYGRKDGKTRGSRARTGVSKRTTRGVIAWLNWEWHPTMSIGSGCKIHLRADELPAGRLIVQCSHHLTAVIDGVIHDTFDPSRDGMRCVYGYWQAR